MVQRPGVQVAVVLEREAQPNRWEDWRFRIVENMAVHVCEKCGHVEHIFGEDGGKRMAAEYQMDYLGALPLNLSIRVDADGGRPSVVNQPDGEIAALYKSVARQVAVKIAQRAKDFSSKFPSISISKDT